MVGLSAAAWEARGFQMTVVYVPGTQEGTGLGEAGRVGLEGTWERLLRTVPPAAPAGAPRQMTGLIS